MTTPNTSAPHRSAPTPRLRRTSQIVLVAGTVVAALAAAGPTWATRVGVVVAVVSAVVACVCAWRELFNAERRHARSMLQASQRHGAQLHDERRQNAGVVDALTTRVRETVTVVEGQRVTIEGLRHEVSSLEGDRTSLRTAVADRDRTLTSLRCTVQKQEVQIAGLETRLVELEAEADGDLLPADLPAADGGEAAEVRHLPRRVRAELDAVAAGTGGAGVLDLRTLASVRGVLPNYEEDRRFA